MAHAVATSLKPNLQAQNLDGFKGFVPFNSLSLSSSFLVGRSSSYLNRVETALLRIAPTRLKAECGGVHLLFGERRNQSRKEEKYCPIRTQITPVFPLAFKSQENVANYRIHAATSTSAQTTEASTASSNPPFNILITGSTKGIGYALACRFLEAGDNVIVCSRSEERVAAVEKELKERFGEERVWGTACDVSNAASVEALASFATKCLGRIDLWINNAGSNAYSYKPLVESDDKDIAEVVQTNTLGVMLCCRQAIRMMREQPTGGHIFNMDGAGADGNATPRFAAYGATKRSLTQFTKSLQAELKMLDIKKVIVHNLSPGMVTTDLLMAGATTRTAKFFINALAEPADMVAEYLVPRVREVPASCGGKSTYIRFLTSIKAYSQIITRIVFKARKDRYVLED